MSSARRTDFAQRQVALGPVSLPFWILALVASVACTCAAIAWRVLAQHRTEKLAATLAHLEAQASAPVPSSSSPRTSSDFTQSLSENAPVDAVVRDLQRFSGAAGVTFVSVEAVPREATERTLGRLDITVRLRGGYPGLKSVLAQLLDRYPHLVLQRLGMRRLASAGEVEASIEMSYLTRPAAPVHGG